MPRDFRRVIKTDMHDLGFAGKNWALLVCLPAHCHNIIELKWAEVGGGLRAMLLNIDSCLRHYFYCMWGQAMFLDAGRVRLNDVTLKPARPAFRPLAPARGPGATKQQFSF